MVERIDLDDDVLEKALSCAELQKICKQLGAATSGSKKKELVKRIRRHEKQVEVG